MYLIVYIDMQNDVLARYLDKITRAAWRLYRRTLSAVRVTSMNGAELSNAQAVTYAPNICGLMRAQNALHATDTAITVQMRPGSARVEAFHRDSTMVECCMAFMKLSCNIKP